MSTGEFVVLHISRNTAQPRIVAVESHQAPDE
jgi:hypothetical protein